MSLSWGAKVKENLGLEGFLVVVGDEEGGGAALGVEGGRGQFSVEWRNAFSNLIEKSHELIFPLLRHQRQLLSRTLSLLTRLLQLPFKQLNLLR